MTIVLLDVRVTVLCKGLPFGRIKFDSEDSKLGDLQDTSENYQDYSKIIKIPKEDRHVLLLLHSPTRPCITSIQRWAY